MSNDNQEQRLSRKDGPTNVAVSPELTDIGGKCPNCGCEDKWEIIHEDRQPTRKAARSGQWLEWHESYELECANLLEDEDDFMHVYKCRTTKTIEQDNEVEYEKDY